MQKGVSSPDFPECLQRLVRPQKTGGCQLPNTCRNTRSRKVAGRSGRLQKHRLSKEHGTLAEFHFSRVMGRYSPERRPKEYHTSIRQTPGLKARERTLG